MKQLEVKGRWMSAVNKSLIARPMRKYEVGFLKVFSGSTITTNRSKALATIVISDNKIMYMAEPKRNLANSSWRSEKISGPVGLVPQALALFTVMLSVILQLLEKFI